MKAPVTTADLLKQVDAFFARFVVLPSESARVALTLYVLHTWAIEAADATPYLVVVSPERQTGKTRCLETLALIVREGWHTASTTEAALFRKIERDTPTLLLDEIDAIFGSSTERTEPLRAALNAGNRRGASATRVVGTGAKMDVRDFAVFCPKVLSGIDTGRLPETIQDRSIMVRMKRRNDGENVERLRFRFIADEVDGLSTDLAEWASEVVDELRGAVPELPDDLSDRAADAWEPLLAIADLAAGDWPENARAAATKLSAQTDGDELGRGAQLLGAIKQAMAGDDRIATTDLLPLINDDDELPFGSWRDGRGLDGRGLARLLKPYEIKPRTLRIGDQTAKGYLSADLRDAWDRYLHPLQERPAVTDDPDEHAGVTDVTPVTPQHTEGDKAIGSPFPTEAVTPVTPRQDEQHDGQGELQDRVRAIAAMSDEAQQERAWLVLKAEVG